MTGRARALVLAVMLVAVARPAGAHSSPARPYDRARIVQDLTGARWTSVRAHWPARTVYLPDPARVGVRVRFMIEPGAGTPQVVELPARGWISRRDHRFTATGCDGRIVRARLRTGRHGGRFTLDLPDCTAPLVPPEATRVMVLVSSGDVRWCAEITSLERRKRQISGRTLTALATCPCEPLPTDTLDAIEQRIFARHSCLGCHAGGSPEVGLSLAPGVAYSNLVGVASITDPPRLRVKPGDPEESVLWRKVAARTAGFDGVPGLGMPVGDPPLDQSELEAVRLWIAAGAPATGTVAPAQALLDCLP